MGALDEVIKLKDQGFEDEQIIRNLEEKGFNPKEISDALSQSRIKSAVSGGGRAQEMDEMYGMEPSILQTGSEDEAPPSQRQKSRQGYYQPQTQEMGEEAPYPQSQYYQEEGQQPGYQQEYYQPQEAYGAEAYAPSSGYDADTMIEIAEQVFSEKMIEIQKQLEGLSEIKAIMQTKIENLSLRLKKIELIIDSLQASILEKVGSYGENLSSIKKEMSMMQESFTKMVPELAERRHVHHKTHHEKEPSHKKSVRKK